jgi:dipeptide/tripeptide permease
MEYLTLMVVSLALMGALTGFYWSAEIHDRRIDSLTAGQYTAMHQMRDATFAKVMPFVGFGTLLVVIASVVFAIEPGWPRWLGVAAVGVMVIDIVFTVRRQLPLNREVQSWTEATIPTHWRAVRDGWAANHRMRTLFGTLACAALLAAIATTLSDWQPPPTASVRGNAENGLMPTDRERSCPLRNRKRDWVIQAETPNLPLKIQSS